MSGGPVAADEVRLAFDTSGPAGSVAIGRGPRVLARAPLTQVGAQSADILPAIRDVMASAGLSLDALQGVVVGAGPGSFTGVRIAAATAKGLVHALGVPLWVVSSLRAAAVSDLLLSEERASIEAELRWVLFDARGERVFAGAYLVGRDASGAPRAQRRVEPHATTVGDVLTAAAHGRPAVFVGDGALRHRERIAAAGFDVIDPPAGIPSAEALLALVHADALPPLDAPARWEPDYVKASSAERAAL